MKTRTIFIFITIIAIVAALTLMGGCKSQAEGGQASGQESSQAEEAVETSEGQEQGTEDETAGASENAEESVEAEEETAPEEEAEEEIVIPEDITLKIQEADGLFADGLYAEASKEYRNAQIAVEGSGLPDETKQQLLESINENYYTSQDILETARMHHSNAMNLIYEKRYDEAEAELLAALDIYPKYQTAIDALESLEDIKGLQ